MRSKYFRLLCAVTIMLMAIMACNIGAPGGSPVATLQPSETALAGQDGGPTATDSQPPTATATLEPAETATETLTPEPSLTPTFEVPVAEVNKQTNCRTGPSGAYDLVVALETGDKVEVVARDLGAGFVFIKSPKSPDQGCWVLQTNLTVTGNLTPLPAFTPPPSPTSAPGVIIQYKNVDTCKGNSYVRFTIKNIGSTQFRSAYVSVTNLKTKEKVEQTIDNFGQWVGCVLAQSISPLGVGQSGFIDSEIFQRGTPKGQKMQASFQVCVEQNLKGACVTQSLSFIAK
jgi:hypothetical protein